MSKINVNTWEPETGTAATLMASGDTVTVPSGAEIDIASGATLDVNGTIDLTGATTTGFPAGGLTQASTWEMTTDFSGSSDPITANWAEESVAGYGTLGTSMTESSGVFTFPATGYWLIQFYASFSLNSASSRYAYSIIQTTVDGAAYTTQQLARSNLFNSSDWTYGFALNHFLMDVTSTSTHKVKFGTTVEAAATVTKGGGTRATFLRLADT